MTFEIVRAVACHAEALGRNLRDGDALEGERLGIGALDGTRESFWLSSVARTALIDGRVAAMWGVVPADGYGRPWLLTAPPCLAVSPLRFARVYSEEAREMLHRFRKLENYVDAGYTGAVRLLQIAGFTLDEAKPYGMMGALFRRFEMVA